MIEITRKTEYVNGEKKIDTFVIEYEKVTGVSLGGIKHSYSTYFYLPVEEAEKMIEKLQEALTKKSNELQ